MRKGMARMLTWPSTIRSRPKALTVRTFSSACEATWPASFVASIAAPAACDTNACCTANAAPMSGNSPIITSVICQHW